MSDCRYGDPTCPCQDGDICHYVAGCTTPAMAVPPEYVDNALNKLEAEIERLKADRDGQRDEHQKCSVALTKKDEAMSVLFGRLSAAGIDFSDLIS